MLAATVVAVLAGIRFSVEGRRLDLLLCAGFSTAAATSLCFGVAPVLGGDPLGTAEAWSAVGGRLLALAAIWLNTRAAGASLPDLEHGSDLPALMVITLALQGFLSLLAVSGFGWRYRAYGEDLDRWLALPATLMLSADLH